MRRIRSVVFDFFGTLVPSFSLSGHTEILGQMADLVQAPRTHFIDRWFATFNERALGVIPDVASNILKICQEKNLSPSLEELEEAVSLRFSYGRKAMVPREAAIPTLRRLKGDGYRLGLISDCSSELPALWGNTEFPDFFDVTIFSCEVGVKKPDPKIYQLASEKLKVTPGECLYIGDGGSKELTGADAVGMHPVLLVDEAEALSTDVHRIGAESWDGTSISELNEVFGILKELKANQSVGGNSD